VDGGGSFKDLLEECLRQAGLNTRTLHERYERQTRDFLPENTIASWRNPHSATGRPTLPGEEKLARVAKWLCALDGVTVTESQLLDARRSDKDAQARRRKESSPAGFPALRSLDRHRHNLPEQLTRFIGREEEIEQLRRDLMVSRLCSLTGVGGSGKTRLALEVARALTDDFDDGVCWVDLASTSEPDLVAQALATALGVREGGTGTYAPKARREHRPLTERLAAHLRGRRVLLVLDNCEHLVEACAGMAEALLHACPQLRILTTTREPLAVAGEAVHRVPPLSVPPDGERLGDEEIQGYESVQLFLDRALQRRPDLHIDRSALLAVLEICQRVDGLALGIELAAARAKMMSPRQILDLLGDRLDLLSAASRSTTARHQTLRAMIDWSHDNLAKGEQVLLRRLSVFVGGFELAAAQQVCSGSGLERFEILDLLGMLVDKSLVETEQHAGITRYRLLETIKAYGAEKLALCGEAGTFRSRHQQWYLALAEEAEPALTGPDQRWWLDRLELDHDNLRAALEPDADGHDAQASLRLAAALGHFWLIRGLLTEGRDHLVDTLAAADVAPSVLRAKALTVVANLAMFDADVETANDHAIAALVLSRQLGYRRGQAWALRTLGAVAVAQERLADGDQLNRESLAICEDLADAWGTAFCVTNAANLEALRGRFASAGELYESSLATRRPAGDAWGQVWSLFRLGTLRTWEARFDDSRRLLEEGHALAEALRYDAGTVLSLLGLGEAAHLRGDQAAARDHYLAAHGRALHLEDAAGVVLSAVGLANVAIARGELGDAAGWLAVPDVARPAGTLSTAAAAVDRCKASLAQASGDHRTALDLHLRVLASRQRLQDARGTIEQLEDVAVLVAIRRPQLAASLLASVDAARVAMGAPIPPAYEARLAAAKQVLHAEQRKIGVEAAWSAGATLTLAEAAELALAAEDAKGAHRSQRASS
jgi:predicted ATPase